jgi:hypothetical protein
LDEVRQADNAISPRLAISIDLNGFAFAGDEDDEEDIVRRRVVLRWAVVGRRERIESKGLTIIT